MISVPQPQEEVQNAINRFSQSSNQREIANRINNSQLTYRYDNLSQFQFEVNLRAAILNSAWALSRSGMNFSVFRKSRCNERYWDRNREGGFVLKKNVLPSEAILDIFQNGRKYASECATAMVIVYYKALLDVFPKELFNSTFRDITLMNWHYLDRNFKDVGMMNRKSDNLPGDRRYFKNPDVDLGHPEWQGENTIFLGNDNFYGHGAGIHSEKEIIRLLNRSRKPGATVSAYLIETAGNPNYKRLSDILTRYNSREVSQISA